MMYYLNDYERRPLHHDKENHYRKLHILKNWVTEWYKKEIYKKIKLFAVSYRSASCGSMKIFFSRVPLETNIRAGSVEYKQIDSILQLTLITVIKYLNKAN